MTRIENIKNYLQENGVTSEQFEKILNLMDKYDDKLYHERKVNHREFEAELYQIVPQRTGNYHFCEDFIQVVKETGKWEATCIALYGNLPKYKNGK